MSYTIGEVEVRFGAKIDRFEAQMNKAAKKLEGLGNTAKRMFGALAGAFAVGKMVQFSKTIMSTADASAKHAKAMGAQLEGMIGLQHAAALSGASVEDLDKALVKMNQNLGKGGDFLARLGMDPAKLAGMSTDEKFLEIADAIGKIEDPAKRTALAMEMFGKGGTKLIATMMEGKGSIRAMAQEAADLGIALNETDAKKFENVNDNFERIQKAIKGAAQTMLVELAPAIDKIAEKAVNVGKAFNSWLKGGAKSDAQMGGEAGKLAQMEQNLGNIERWKSEGKFKDNPEDYERLKKYQLDMINQQRGVVAQEKTAEAAKRARAQAEEEDKRLQGVADSLAEKFAPDLSGQRAELDDLLASGKITPDIHAAAMEDLNKKDPAYQQAEALQKEMEKADEEVKRRAESIAASVATPLEVFQDKMKEIDELEASGALSGEMADRARQKAWEDAGGLGEARGADGMGPDGKPLGTNTRGIAGGDVGALIAQQQLQKGAEDRQAAIQRLHEQQKTLLERIEANTRTPQGTWA